jgi:hypothetical protein
MTIDHRTSGSQRRVYKRPTNTVSEYFVQTVKFMPPVRTLGFSTAPLLNDTFVECGPEPTLPWSKISKQTMTMTMTPGSPAPTPAFGPN